MTISEESEGKVIWGLTVDCKVQGMDRPFRLRVTSDDESEIIRALEEFSQMIFKKLEEM